jgi:hypothetical protein
MLFIYLTAGSDEFFLFIIETIVSAGCEIIAQKTPAIYPDMKVTDS